VESTIGLLWIQKFELSSAEIWIEDFSLHIAALNSSNQLQNSSALWSLADLFMQSHWRKIRLEDTILTLIVEQLENGGPCARKNAALVIGNYCCDCTENQLRFGR
jgi:hypothetical protein